MTQDSTPSRRTFLKGGALLAAPIAAPACAVALADDGLRARIKRLEDEAALRELHDGWLRQVNAGERHALLGDAVLGDAVRRITADHAGAPDRIEVAADGRSAVGRFDCAVEAEMPLAKDCTLAQMAHLQGHGTLRRTERRMLTVHYVKAGGGWQIAQVASTTL